MHREASTIKSFVLLKFDVAKLGYTRGENKKRASTTALRKIQSINELQKQILYSITARTKAGNKENHKNLYNEYR
ncbi:hypothetical protein JCM16496A_22560 [Bacteroides rodentium JCM 16496]